MNATRTVLIIKQQVFESTEDIIILYIFHIIIAISYVFFFYISSQDYAFYYFRNNRKNFARLFNGSSKQPLGLCA